VRSAWNGLVAAPAAGPAAVLVTGAPRTGKSTLARTALRELDPAPAVVLSGHARIHSPAPYDWLAAVLVAHGAAVPGGTVPDDALSWLAQRPGEPEQQRYAPATLLRLAVRVVWALAGAGPALLVVEDLHALDPASLNLIGELAAVPGLPALLLVLSRPVPDHSLAAAVLGRLEGMAGAVRMPLGGGDGPVPLTARELEVAACLGAGMSNKQVAGALGISVRTVAVHVSNVMRKTGSASRTEVAVWALRNGQAPA
jgi:two-component system nitrate/nitrite response regulator NarL